MRSVRWEVEWFVQHAAERVTPHAAWLTWGGVLRAADASELTIVTTNYDRAIELAANAEGEALDDGFGVFGHGEVAEWIGFSSDERPRLVKLHGSTDWYAADDGGPVKLRHPMPLFGRASLELSSGLKLGSALVLPSMEKMLTHSPYPRLSQAFLNAADMCDFAVFVGSSLRDSHTRGAAMEIARRKPVFLVNVTGDSYGIEDAVPVRQYASQFLISTLPRAFYHSDPVAELGRAAGLNDECHGMLSALSEALDVESPVNRRCEAIERLDRRRASLDSRILGGLLADPELAVARYALGLVAHLSTAREFLEYAEGCEHSSNLLFAEDLTMLRALLDGDVS